MADNLKDLGFKATVAEDPFQIPPFITIQALDRIPCANRERNAKLMAYSINSDSLKIQCSRILRDSSIGY